MSTRAAGREKPHGGFGRRSGERESHRGEAAGRLTAVPQDGLQVGSDKGGAVGRCRAPFPLAGEALELVLELGC